MEDALAAVDVVVVSSVVFVDDLDFSVDMDMEADCACTNVTPNAEDRLEEKW